MCANIINYLFQAAVSGNPAYINTLLMCLNSNENVIKARAAVVLASLTQFDTRLYGTVLTKPGKDKYVSDGLLHEKYQFEYFGIYFSCCFLATSLHLHSVVPLATMRQLVDMVIRDQLVASGGLPPTVPGPSPVLPTSTPVAIPNPPTVLMFSSTFGFTSEQVFSTAKSNIFH